jgi:trimeric autotransporter adhesin
MVLARPCVLACSLPLLGLVAPGCIPVPPEVVDHTDGTSADPSGTVSADSSTDPTPGTTTTDTDVVPDGTSSAGTGDTETASDCGNGIAEADEDCDDADLADATCETLGFGGGTLVCDAGCTYDLAACGELPAAPVLALGLSQVKQFDFSWEPVADADHYRLLERPEPMTPYVQLGDDIMGESISITMPLHFRHEASYVLQACNAFGCTDSEPVDVVGSLAEAVGYFKASNTGQDDGFGFAMAISGDGTTLAVGAHGEDSSATGIDGPQGSGANDSGAVYVFVRDPATHAWSQQAYVKASNTGSDDRFGVSVALSADGSTLAVGADFEDSAATGINGSQASGANNSGAVYVFVRDGAGTWSEQAYVKASNTGADDRFGRSVALSSSGDTLAVGAWQEDSNATTIGGSGADNSASDAGAAYVFVRNAASQWSQQAYIKASNAEADDAFGWSVALSGDGNTLAVGAEREDGGATGIDGDANDDSAANAGAVYVFVRGGLGAWSQQAYVKASNPDVGDSFGFDVALSEDGSTLVVGAPSEASNATGIDGNQADDTAANAGAVYVFVRDAMDEWSQQAYVKASNAQQDDSFGVGVALSADGSTLAVGAWQEDGGALGLQGDQADGTQGSGAAYVLVRDGAGTWWQQAYVKAPNTGVNDSFAWSVALSGDAGTLAVGADWEDSSAIGIGGDQSNDAASNAGAVYAY